MNEWQPARIREAERHCDQHQQLDYEPYVSSADLLKWKIIRVRPTGKFEGKCETLEVNTEDAIRARPDIVGEMNEQHYQCIICHACQVDTD